MTVKEIISIMSDNGYSAEQLSVWTSPERELGEDVDLWKWAGDMFGISKCDCCGEFKHGRDYLVIYDEPLKKTTITPDAISMWEDENGKKQSVFFYEV